MTGKRATATKVGTGQLAHPGHRKAPPRTRHRLLHPPPGPRTGNPPAHRQARSPRPPRHPGGRRRLTRPAPPDPDRHHWPGSATGCPA